MSNFDNLNKYNFKFNKAYGQNFIFDKNFLSSIINGVVDKETVVLEIGAGAGTLTSILCENAKKVYSFEIDNNLKPILEEKLSPYSNIELIFGDVMKFSTKEIEEKIGENYIIVANIPYYITTPIIFKFLEESEKMKSMTIMIQLEVAERIIAKPGSKNYGAITPAIDYRGDAKIIKKVSRKMFTPIPNVDSAIVKIDLNKDKFSVVNPKVTDETIKCAFAMRRKTLENNIRSYFKFPSNIIDEIFNECNLDKTIRGEKLTTAELVNLSNIIAKYV